MQFGNLGYLVLLLIAPVALWFLFWSIGQKKKALAMFVHQDVVQALTNSVSFGRQKIKSVLFCLGLFFLLFALLQPKWGFHWEEVKRKGLDLMIAVDVSKSMLAEDIKPNRLEAAKREIKSLINMLQGDRVGLVAFAGTSFLQCPLTLDYGTAKLFVDHLDTSIIPLGGTDIGGAIRTSIKAYEGHEKMHRVLIFITDGEDHKENVMDAVEEAKKKGVVIFPIGIGKREGAPIPLIDEAGRRGFVKDRNGQVILSKRDDVLLQRIALVTGGKKGSIGTGQFPLEEIYESEVSKMEKRELESSRQKKFEQRFQIFIFFALLCFLIEALISERRTKKRELVYERQ